MSDEKLCGAATEAPESEHNIEDCKTQKIRRHVFIGVKRYPIMPTDILQALALSYHNMSWTAQKTPNFYR